MLGALPRKRRAKSRVRRLSRWKERDAPMFYGLGGLVVLIVIIVIVLIIL
jgi:hypothetical protein